MLPWVPHPAHPPQEQVSTVVALIKSMDGTGTVRCGAGFQKSWYSEAEADIRKINAFSQPQVSSVFAQAVGRLTRNLAAIFVDEGSSAPSSQLSTLLHTCEAAVLKVMCVARNQIKQ
jgi:hypothetical protein